MLLGEHQSTYGFYSIFKWSKDMLKLKIRTMHIGIIFICYNVDIFKHVEIKDWQLFPKAGFSNSRIVLLHDLKNSVSITCSITCAIAIAVTGHGKRRLRRYKSISRVRTLSVTRFKSIITYSIHFKHVLLCLRAHEIQVWIPCSCRDVAWFKVNSI